MSDINSKNTSYFINKFNSEDEYINAKKYTKTPFVSFNNWKTDNKSTVYNEKIIYEPYVNNTTKIINFDNQESDILWEIGTFRFCAPLNFGKLSDTDESQNIEYHLDLNINDYKDPILNYKPIGFKIANVSENVNIYAGFKYISSEDTINCSVRKQYMDADTANNYVKTYRTISTNYNFTNLNNNSVSYIIPGWKLPSDIELQLFSQKINTYLERIKELYKYYSYYVIPMFDSGDFITSNSGLTAINTSSMTYVNKISDTKKEIFIPFIRI